MDAVVEPHAFDAFRGKAVDLLVTSPHSLLTLQRLPLDPHWRVLALAPKTSATLIAAGIRVELALSGGAAALAAQARPGPVLLLSSDLGGEEARQIRPDLIKVTTYYTCCPSALPPAALAALQHPYDILFASPSSVQNFLKLVPNGLHKVRQIFAHGRSTLSELEHKGHRALLIDMAKIEVFGVES